MTRSSISRSKRIRKKLSRRCRLNLEGRVVVSWLREHVASTQQPKMVILNVLTTRYPILPRKTDGRTMHFPAPFIPVFVCTPRLDGYDTPHRNTEHPHFCGVKLHAYVPSTSQKDEG
ncbi:hypothetical protein E4T56_gene12452 [Termitomyces sp. T112]|nr:hypothetical protein E4T56_gene12452 [Termitomyces sp. T112]